MMVHWVTSHISHKVGRNDQRQRRHTGKRKPVCRENTSHEIMMYSNLKKLNKLLMPPKRQESEVIITLSIHNRGLRAMRGG